MNLVISDSVFGTVAGAFIVYRLVTLIISAMDKKPDLFSSNGRKLREQ
jgi:hypothetical protein